MCARMFFLRVEDMGAILDSIAGTEITHLSSKGTEYKEGYGIQMCLK